MHQAVVRLKVCLNLYKYERQSLNPSVLVQMNVDRERFREVVFRRSPIQSAEPGHIPISFFLVIRSSQSLHCIIRDDLAH